MAGAGLSSSDPHTCAQKRTGGRACKRPQLCEHTSPALRHLVATAAAAAAAVAVFGLALAAAAAAAVLGLALAAAAVAAAGFCLALA